MSPHAACLNLWIDPPVVVQAPAGDRAGYVVPGPHAVDGQLGRRRRLGLPHGTPHLRVSRCDSLF